MGIVQGLTEFIPVSSSGHLVLAQHLLHVQDPEILSFDIFVHLGTLISLAAVLWRDIRDIAVGVLQSVPGFRFAQAYRSNEQFRTGVMLCIGSVPAGIVGILFHRQIVGAFGDPKLVAMNFAITGLLLWLTRFSRPKPGQILGITGALLVGLGEACSIFPGISRTGITTSIALYLKTTPDRAARFSFLLAVPAIAGGAILEMQFTLLDKIRTEMLPIVAGTLASALTGYLVIKWMFKVLERGKFSLFSFYCLAVSLFGILFIS